MNEKGIRYLGGEKSPKTSFKIKKCNEVFTFREKFVTKPYNLKIFVRKKSSKVAKMSSKI